MGQVLFQPGGIARVGHQAPGISVTGFGRQLQQPVWQLPGGPSRAQLFCHLINGLHTSLIARRHQVVRGFQAQALKGLLWRRLVIQPLTPCHKCGDFLIAGDLIFNSQIERVAIQNTQNHRVVFSLSADRGPCAGTAFERHMAKPEPVRVGPHAAGQRDLELGHRTKGVQTARQPRDKQVHQLISLMIVKRRLAGHHHRPQQQVGTLRIAQRYIAHAHCAVTAKRGPRLTDHFLEQLVTLRGQTAFMDLQLRFGQQRSRSARRQALQQAQALGVQPCPEVGGQNPWPGDQGIRCFQAARQMGLQLLMSLPVNAQSARQLRFIAKESQKARLITRDFSFAQRAWQMGGQAAE